MTSPYRTPHPLPADQPLRVRADTPVGSLAKSIVLTLLERYAASPLTAARVEVRAMGPGPVNQAVKSLVIARKQLRAQVRDCTFVVDFDNHREGADDINVITFQVTLVP